MSSELRVAPISLRQANAYIEQVHRHHGRTRGMRFAVGVVDRDGELRGVGVAGRPVSRVLDAAGYIEVTRVATEKSKRLAEWVDANVPVEWQAPGAPIITTREGMFGTRSVPFFSPWGGYDIAAIALDVPEVSA